jgi:hypothetical protein
VENLPALDVLPMVTTVTITNVAKSLYMHISQAPNGH